MIQKLRRKFVWINMGLITVVLLAIFCGVYGYTAKNIERQSMQAMEDLARNSGAPFDFKQEFGGGPGGFRKPPNNMVYSQVNFTLKLDNSGTVTQIVANNAQVTDEKASDLAKTVLSSGKTTGVIRSEQLRFLLAPTPEGRQIVFIDRSLELGMLKNLVVSSLIVGALALLVFWAISIFLARWAVKPVERSWKQQKQFVADASHELKTPLAVILANIDVVLSNPQDTVEGQRKWLHYIQAEARRMKELIQALLYLAKSDGGGQPSAMSEVNLSDLVNGSVLAFEPLAFEQGKTLECSVDENVTLAGDKGRLKQLVVILLDNAVKHSNERAAITVSLKDGPEKAKLEVNNTGLPIPTQELEHIFERFYRLDKARARETGGYGLGLSIAQNIVDAHHGKISVRSNEKNGTTFSVSLPRTPEKQRTKTPPDF